MNLNLPMVINVMVIKKGVWLFLYTLDLILHLFKESVKADTQKVMSRKLSWNFKYQIPSKILFIYTYFKIFFKKVWSTFFLFFSQSTHTKVSLWYSKHDTSQARIARKCQACAHCTPHLINAYIYPCFFTMRCNAIFNIF